MISEIEKILELHIQGDAQNQCKLGRWVELSGLY
jgi:hypothetical protein